MTIPSSTRQRKPLTTFVKPWKKSFMKKNTNQNRQNLVPVMKILILLHLTKTMNLMNLKRNLSLKKRISKKPAKYQSTDEEYHTSESETEEQTEKRRVQCRKAPNIAHWLLTLLDENSSAIGWTHKSHGEFKILDQKKLAKMWGERKG